MSECTETQFPSSEGWDLFEVEGKLEIQRDDEMEIFASDDDAIAHVTRMAQAGSQIHQEALSRHLTDAVKPVATRGLRM